MQRAAPPGCTSDTPQTGVIFELAQIPVAKRRRSQRKEGRLLLCSISTTVHHRRRKQAAPVALGSLACAAQALRQPSKRLPVKALLGHAKQITKSWPEGFRLFLAGAFAGALSKTVTAPLETIRMQMMTGSKGSLRDVMAGTWQRGGVLGFFSGNEADVLRTMPSKAIELSAFDLYKRLLSRRDAETGLRKPAGGIATSVAGALAGITSTVAMFPLETARTRMAVRGREVGGLGSCLHRIVTQEGFPALYKGLDASLVGVIPYAAVRLAMYDGLKHLYTKGTGNKAVPPGESMLFGALAAVTATTVSFPLEVIRRRAMMGTVQGNMLTATRLILATEGVGALYKGVWLSWVKQAPQYAVTFWAFDVAKGFLTDDSE